MPALKNTSKIFPKKHAFKFLLLIDNNNPQTFISISHNFEGLPEWPGLFDLYFFTFARLQQRLYAYGAVIISAGGLVGDSHDIQKDIFEV